MKRYILILALLIISLDTLSQGQEDVFSGLYKIDKIQLVQNICTNTNLLTLKLYCLDSIACRTDSIFLTDSPFYFHFKSYDNQGFLRVFGSIHIHINIKSISDLPDAKTLLSPLYQDCFFFENYTILDKAGKPIILALTSCEYYSIIRNGSLLWEEFGTDEFGIKNIITGEQIKRMPIDR